MEDYKNQGYVPPPPPPPAAAPGYPPAPGYQAAPVYQAAPGYQAAPVYQAAPGYPVAAGYPAAAPNPLSMPGAQPLHVASEWSTGLLDCFSDCNSCLLTWCCPCISFGRIAEIVDRGSSSCGMSGAMYTLIALMTGFQCLYSCTYREKLRKQYGLKVSPCSDICVHFWCEPCALCQAYRELQNRGFDMALGWHGNVEKMQGGGMIQPPPVQGAMMR